MSGIDEATPLLELATLVSSGLREREVSVVLSGGAAVSIHSDNAYESYDLDFVQVGLARKVDAAMRALGFEPRGRHWVHPRSRYWVEFSPGPVAVGNEVLHEFEDVVSHAGVLRVLRPTDCVKDRLTWVIHGDDLQCLDQAVEVALRHPVDFAQIERWAAAQSPAGPESFAEFMKRLASRRD